MPIREATHKDMDAICALCAEAHQRSCYASVPREDMVIRKIVLFIISAPTQFAWVAEKDGVVEGVLLGHVDQLWWSRKRQASDLVFYVRDCARGQGVRLAKRFLAWCQEQGILLYGMSVSFGGDEIKRTGDMLMRLGLPHVGGIYMRVNEQ